MEGVRSKYATIQRLIKEIEIGIADKPSVELLRLLSELHREGTAFRNELEKVAVNAVGEDAKETVRALRAEVEEMIDKASASIGQAVKKDIEPLAIPSTSVIMKKDEKDPNLKPISIPPFVDVEEENEKEPILGGKAKSHDPVTGLVTFENSGKEPERPVANDGMRNNPGENASHHSSTPISINENAFAGSNSQRYQRNDLPMVQLKLDKIELQVFGGDLVEWISFRDQFRDMIHDNPNLSSLVKFHQLRTHLKGAALETVNGYKFSSQNYESAWADLIKRYDRTDNIIEEYIRKFIELPIMNAHPTGSKFTSMIDATNQMLRALPNWGIEVRSWDPWIKFMIVTKVDDNTRRAWKQEIGRRQQVPLSELLEFLEVRAMEIQPTQGDRLRQMFASNSEKKNKERPKRMFHVAQGMCANCNENHPLYRCKKLLDMKAKDRTEVIKRLNLCFRCLGSHERDQCKFNECPTCKGPHNSLLCYKREKERLQAKRNNENDGKVVNHLSNE